ncbi:Dual specificity protein kinase pom1 [Grifola frondosa]|uniref:dual-specificity kinase n=1 Tax=Grifola frondosa TaxID=5627 RepID=A0A1C7MH88_GRIFR|nr:Dual specificity protein kinase pom1 [Grifola frondosa]
MSRHLARPFIPRAQRPVAIDLDFCLFLSSFLSFPRSLSSFSWSYEKERQAPALEFGDPKASSDGDVQLERNVGRDARLAQVLSFFSRKSTAARSSQQSQPYLQVAEDPVTEPEHDAPRPTSTTSSLDPYYFGVHSPSQSPMPPLPTMPSLPKTPEMHPLNEPVTPGKDPAAIDRRGLVGVGELATPRWARGARKDEYEVEDQVDEFDDDEGLNLIAEDYVKDLPDSPWTIEAVDGEQDDKEEFLEVKPVARSLRSRRSAADESGGEEILYPRHPHHADDPQLLKMPGQLAAAAEISLTPMLEEPASIVTPPSAFAMPTHRAKKRTSEEFEMDNSGVLVSKHASGMTPTTKEKDKTAVRRHRSLGIGLPSPASSKDKAKERRRDTLSVSVRHSRQTSASSSSSSHGENHHSRRVHPSDFSHLPPSPSSSSIQQFLKHSGSTNSITSSPLHPQPHGSANVAHSLLRGTQEGWSDLDDQATAEALRKLDGLSSRTARARSSIGGHSRMGSSSRPGTPAKNTTTQWEGIDGGKSVKRSSVHASVGVKDKEKAREGGQRQVLGLGLTTGEPSVEADHQVVNGEDALHGSPVPEKTAKKTGSASARASFTPKRGSASSGTNTSTPTTSSRDSASLSIATSATSVSAASGRQSMNKARRNSAGSDISSVHSGDAASVRDRAAALAVSTDAPEESVVPPVPPLPKDFSTYKSPLTSPSIAFPIGDHADGPDRSKRETFNDVTYTSTLEVPSFPTTPSKHISLQVQKSTTPTNPQKTPSKKWSFSSALGKKLSNSPSTSSMKDAAAKSPILPISPRGLSFGQQIRKSISREHSLSSNKAMASDKWSPVNSDAMASATSLASLSSVGSAHPSLSPCGTLQPTIGISRTPDRLVSSRTGSASSASTNVPPAPHHAPLSPSASVRRNPSTKRLTPSSIPFFRRSSAQSVQVPAANAMPPPRSPTGSPGDRCLPLICGLRLSPTKDMGIVSPVIPGSAKKSSVLSLGLPSLLKGSSSRRSLHSDKEKSDAKSSRENHHASHSDKDKHKKEERDRSESRISVLMGRKRGKTLSSGTPKKPEPVAMPPLQMSALPPSTAQRVANLKSSSNSSLSSINGSTRTPSSRALSQTVSSMQKQSDTSLRTRNALPTIAGSPSVGGLQAQGLKDVRDPPPSSLNAALALSKETPTKIPRISSRSSAVNSPTLKSNGAGRRASLIIGSSTIISSSRGTSPNAGNDSTNEFGVFENGQVQAPKTATSSQRHSIRASPSAASRVPRQVTATTSTTTNGTIPRKNRESMSFGGLRKASTGSVASISSVAQNESQPQSQSHHRFSALSPSKGLKLLAPKMSLPTARSNASSTPSIQQTMASPSLSRQSISTPSPAPSSVDEEELLGDEEMLQYIRRQQAKRLASGASQEELDNLLRFPEPIDPALPMTPASILKSNHVQYLSEYECKEILDYPSIYCIGAHSEKKKATCDNSTNNHGYDDERGDYLVVAHDHLAYRYEIIDTLGKGSFGQVLNCRDHCTGESVAIKIIRNKKRFHHQALVEIKILDSLRKWDQEEKHHVIKMTEHFYFRNHLCIAMELLSINLYELIKANGFVGFTTGLIRRFTSQMLQSLSLMRHHRIVHCDLKPENVLLRHPAKSAIKVIDFGSSCFEHEKIYTYIQSRFYRSPEVILGMNYHMAIDMWSLGCIMAELYTGFPIFPGENEQEQLACIMEVLGVPDKEYINRSSRKRLFFDTTGAPRPVVNSKNRRRRPGTKSLAQVLRCDDDLFVDFISKCLVWDPERRIKPQAALRHPYITAGRRAKITSPAPGTAKALLTSTTSNLGSRSSKQVPETPKKSLISAPTPLTARATRTSGVPTTPSSSGAVHSTLGSSSRSYRSSQAQSMSSYHSSRTMATAK